MTSSWLTLEQAAREFSLSEKKILLLVASKAIKAKTRQGNGASLLVNDVDLAAHGFVRREDSAALVQHLKHGVINIIKAVGLALAVKVLMNVDIVQIVQIIINHNIYDLPGPPGLSEEGVDFVPEQDVDFVEVDKSEIEELVLSLVQED